MSLWDSKSFRLFSWALVLGYMGIIFYLSSLTTVNIPSSIPQLDKILHFHLYFGLAFLVANALPGTHNRKRFLLAFLVATLYGASDEFHQYFVPPRECSIFDWLADAAGSWVGVWIYLKSEGIWRKN